jgi:hypothetical protein
MKRADSSAIFIIGRQHSGNTMLASIFEKVPSLRSMRGESTFFEYESIFDRLQLPARIRAVAESLKVSDQPDLSDTLVDELCEHLGGLNSENGTTVCPSSAELYSMGMDWIARQTNAERWSQKATSYVFYVPNVLRVFPEAKLLFMLRNPLDLLASAERRAAAHNSWSTQMVRLALGWNKAVKLALEYRKKFANNFMIIKYEDLTAQPDIMLRAVFDFLEVTFDPAYLEVHHVNRSESPYNLTSDNRGINVSRVHYYRETLPARSIRALTSLISADLLEQTYPELNRGIRRRLPPLVALPLYLSGMAVTLNEQARLVLHATEYALRRTWQRLK